MKLLTEGLEMTARHKITRVLEAFSSNRAMGCATGAGVTALIQSSSATTVMLIGFVGAGIMTLEQAVGVIIGANIGTTVTAQMIAFKLTAVALPAIAIGVPLRYFPRKRRYRHIGEIILGFGLLFYGMTVMKNGLAPIRTDPEFIAFFTKFSTDSTGGLLLCVAMGALVTVMVQSSSATVGLTMTLAIQGLLTFPTALALVLGENIGTTITAQLATIGSNNVNVHRTARAHAVFNVAGVTIMLCIFPWFVEVVTAFSSFMGVGPVDQTLANEYHNIPRYLANGHMLFNVINAAVFLLLLPRLVQLVIFFTPSRKEQHQRYRLPSFETNFIDSPIAALASAKGEITRMAEFTRMNLKKVSICIGVRDDDTLAERESVESHIDAMQKVIIKYLITIFQSDLNASEAGEISEMMRITNNIERIGDSMENVSKLLERIYENDIHLSQTAREDLLTIANAVDQFMKMVIGEFGQASSDFYPKAAAQEDLVDHMREKMRHNHIDRLRQGECSVDAGVHFITLLSNFEKMGDYCFNIALGVNRIHR